MDIRKHKSVAPTGTLHLKDAEGELLYSTGADGEPDLSKPCRAVIYGPGSAQYVKASQKGQDAMMAEFRSSKGKFKRSAAMLMKDRAEFLADITQALENIEGTDDEGKPLTGRDLFLAYYTDPAVGFIPKQIDEYIEGWENFKKT